MLRNKAFQTTRSASLILSFILVVALTFCGWGQAIAAPIVDSSVDSPAEIGKWELVPRPVKKDQMQSVHTILLPNGKVLTLNGSSFRTTLIRENGKDTFLEGVDVKDYNIVNNSILFDPEHPATKSGFQRIPSPPAIQNDDTNDLFCAGHLQLADGNVLVISGTGRYYPGSAFTGSRQINLYNWQTEQWSNLGLLKEGRWYPTLVSLADGKIAIFSGLKLDNPNQINPTLEIYDPKTQKIHYFDLTKFKNSPFNTKIVKDQDGYDSIDLYPKVFPTIDGRLLITGDEAGIGGVLVPHTSKKSYLMSIKDENGKLSLSFAVGPERGETSKAYGTGLQDPNSAADVLLLGGIIGTNDINFGRFGNGGAYPEGSRISSSLQRWVSPPQNSGENGKWEIVDKFLDQPRANLQAVILPSKEVLIVNGGEYPQYKPVYQPLLMISDPTAPGGYRTKTMKSAKLPRLYHNGAILLPDARVLVIGGNANRTAREKDGTLHVNILADAKTYYRFPTLKRLGKIEDFDLNNYYKSPQSYFVSEQGNGKDDPLPFVPSEIWQAEIFSPPYLFKPGNQPEIQSAPDEIAYGQSGKIKVKNATKTSSLVLVKLGSVTHSFDFGQRLADLKIDNISLGDESEFQFTAPENANLYPPGYYMMFYLNELGKPSHAKMVKLGVA